MVWISSTTDGRGGGYVGATRTFRHWRFHPVRVFYSFSAICLMYMKIIEIRASSSGRSSCTCRLACAAIKGPLSSSPEELWRTTADGHHTFHHTSFRMEACHFSVRCINDPSTACLLLNRRPKARRPESGDAGTTCIFAALGRIWIGWQDIRCASWTILPSVE